MTKTADLHIHTHFSDSTSSPQEVIQEAKSQGLSCIAVTDHDTIDGLGPTWEVARTQDIEVINGIELSTEVRGKDIHILGYCFDAQSPILIGDLKKFQDARITRMKLMLEKLSTLGIDNITLEEVTSRTQSNAVGRPHLAALLVEKGWVANVSEAFNRYLGEGGPVYVSKFKHAPHEAISLIKKAGGVAVLAHPALTNRDELIPGLVEAGLGGIEVHYPNSTKAVIQYYTGIAKKHGLVMTGGSDAHGKNRQHTYVGKVRIPYEWVEELKKRILI